MAMLAVVLVLWAWQYFTSPREGLYLAVAFREHRMWEIRMEGNACSILTIEQWPHNAREAGLIYRWQGLWGMARDGPYLKPWADLPGIRVERDNRNVEIVLSDAETEEWLRRHAGRYPIPSFSGPRRCWQIIIQNWAVVMALAICSVPCVMGIRRLHISRQRKRCGLCVSCGYDLRESKDRCPECGVIAVGGGRG